MTDTIKRRLESPAETPRADRHEFKRSKIPLALKSPVPIKKEIKEGSSSRASSLERTRRMTASPATDSLASSISADSIEPSASVRAAELDSVPSTPDVPRKDSSTFNLLQDSDLFTQISKNELQPGAKPERVSTSSPDPCHVVAVREHEIVKGTVSPSDHCPFESVEALLEFIPQSAEVEAVEVLDDTENDSSEESGHESDREPDAERASVHLGSEPKTFVIEVKTFEQRRRPTLGILKRKNSADDNESSKSMRVSADVPDLIPAGPGTPPPTPSTPSTPPTANLHRDEINEYLILDEVSVGPQRCDAAEKHEYFSDSGNEPVKRMGVSIGGSTPDRIKKRIEIQKEEVIYSEVDDRPQVNNIIDNV